MSVKHLVRRTRGAERSLLLVLAATVAAIAAMAPPAGAQPTVIRTIDFPGGDIVALGLDASRGKLFVSEDNGGNLLVVDTTSYQTLATIPVGGAAFDIAVDESRGRVYVASEKGCCTTGVTEGTGKISVIDSATNAKVKEITETDFGQINGHSFFSLGADEGRDRVYLAFVNDRFGYIDASNDTYVPLRSDPNQAGRPEVDDRTINPVTGEAYIYSYGLNRVYVVNGATVSEIDLGATGARGPLDMTVNQVENKLYISMISVPGQGEIGILILDRDTGAHKFVGKEDLAPLIFNPATNRLFSGVQVGQFGAVVDGATDALTPVEMESGGISGAGVVRSSDHAYLSSADATWVLDGKQACAHPIPSNLPREGGLVSNEVVVDQGTGRVYVTNAGNRVPKVLVIQDAAVTCPPPKTEPGFPLPPTLPDSPPPASVFSLDGARALRGGSIRVQLFTPGAGALSLRATARLPARRRARRSATLTVARRALVATRRGRMTVTLRPTAAARRALARHRRLRVRLTATFTPESGAAPVTRRRAVTLRAARRGR